MCSCDETRLLRHTFRFELDPNRAQRVQLAKSVGGSRFVFNWGLDYSQRAYELTGRRPRLGDLKRELVRLKKDDCSWLYEISAHIGQQALVDLDRAFERFFDGLNSKPPRSGFPRFKRKGDRDSARVYEVTLEERYIRLPKIGRVRLKETRSERGFDGRILSATIRRRADRWFVSLAVDRDREIELRPVRRPRDIVGLDLGITNAAVIHDGVTTRVLEPRRALRKNLSSCQRQDFLHQLTSSLTKTKSVIVVENLHVRGMQRNRSLALSIGDAGMRELRRQLAYKTEWYGSTLVLADRFYPSSKMCSDCGVVKEGFPPSDRLFKCDACGSSLDRDENAAINLRNLALAHLPEGLGEVTPVERKALAPASARNRPRRSRKEQTAASAAEPADRRGNPSR